MTLKDDSPIPGVLDVLRELKRMNFKIAVVTGRAVDEDCIWRELKRYGMADYVDCVISNKSVGCEELFSKVEILGRLQSNWMPL